MIQIVGPQLSQWDTGRTISVNGSDATHAHFANWGDTHAVIMDVVDGGVKVPDYLLQTGRDLCVYIVFNGVTQESKMFSVRKRERPENYVYENDQRNYIYKLIEDAQAATEDARTAAEDAQKAARQTAEDLLNLAEGCYIMPSAYGRNISLQDAANAPLRGLSVYGKTTRSGTALNAAGAGGSINATIKRWSDVSVGRVQTPLTKQAANPVSIGGVKIGGSDVDSYIFAFRAAQNSAGDAIVGTFLRLRSISLTNTETLQTIFYDFGGLQNADGTTKDLPVGATAQDGSWVNVARYGANVKATEEYIYWKNAHVDSLCAFELRGIPDGRYRIDFGLVANSTGAAEDIYIMPAGEQTIAIPTPGGLHGIEVTTGGYYTDESGKQWHCDEVDLARGVYVQRCGYIASYNGEDIPGAYISSSGSLLSKGAKVVYALPKPVETPLDQKTLAAYAALHTYKPYTVVSNNAGAGMLVEYVADTKTYIDNRITELRNAVIATGANI